MSDTVDFSEEQTGLKSIYELLFKLRKFMLDVLQEIEHIKPDKHNDNLEKKIKATINVVVDIALLICDANGIQYENREKAFEGLQKLTGDKHGFLESNLKILHLFVKGSKDINYSNIHYESVCFCVHIRTFMNSVTRLLKYTLGVTDSSYKEGQANIERFSSSDNSIQMLNLMQSIINTVSANAKDCVKMCICHNDTVTHGSTIVFANRGSKSLQGFSPMPNVAGASIKVFEVANIQSGESSDFGNSVNECDYDFPNAINIAKNSFCIQGSNMFYGICSLINDGALPCPTVYIDNLECTLGLSFQDDYPNVFSVILVDDAKLQYEQSKQKHLKLKKCKSMTFLELRAKCTENMFLHLVSIGKQQCVNYMGVCCDFAIFGNVYISSIVDYYVPFCKYSTYETFLNYDRAKDCQDICYWVNYLSRSGEACFLHVIEANMLEGREDNDAIGYLKDTLNPLCIKWITKQEYTNIVKAAKNGLLKMEDVRSNPMQTKKIKDHLKEYCMCRLNISDDGISLCKDLYFKQHRLNFEEHLLKNPREFLQKTHDAFLKFFLDNGCDRNEYFYRYIPILMKDLFSPVPATFLKKEYQDRSFVYLQVFFGINFIHDPWDIVVDDKGLEQLNCGGLSWNYLANAIISTSLGFSSKDKRRYVGRSITDIRNATAHPGGLEGLEMLNEQNYRALERKFNYFKRIFKFVMKIPEFRNLYNDMKK